MDKRRILDTLSRIIHQKAGLYLKQSDKAKLQKYLEELMSKGEIKSFDEAVSKVSTSRTFLNQILDVITINETYFFRHKNQFDVLEKQILPEVFKKYRRANLWSAGCSTGEEPYTMAIVSLEVATALEMGSSNIKILANDISEKALERAQKGVYDNYAVRFVPKNLLEKYFEKLPDGRFKIRQKIKIVSSFFTA